MGKLFLNTGGDGMSGTGVEGAEGEGTQPIITLGSAAVFGAVADCLRAQLGRDRDRCINVRYHASSISRRSSRNYLDDQGRSRHKKTGRISFSDPAHLVQT
jgi:hypothetical protein